MMHFTIPKRKLHGYQLASVLRQIHMWREAYQFLIMWCGACCFTSLCLPSLLLSISTVPAQREVLWTRKPGFPLTALQLTIWTVETRPSHGSSGYQRKMKHPWGSFWPENFRLLTLLQRCPPEYSMSPLSCPYIVYLQYHHSPLGSEIQHGFLR